MPDKPLHHLQLQSEMKLRGLQLRDVVRGTSIPYTKASEVLNGVRNCARTLRTLQARILKNPRLIAPETLHA